MNDWLEQWRMRLTDLFIGAGELTSALINGPIQFIRNTVWWANDLLDKRRWQDAWAGLPALLMVLLLAAMLISPALRRSKERVDGLHDAATAHLAAGRYAQARLAALRLTKTQSETQEGNYLLYKALRGMRRDTEAARLLNRLAPEQGIGHSSAHVDRAIELFTDKPPKPEAGILQLDKALLIDPHDQRALELRVRVAIAQRDWSTALRYQQDLTVENRLDLQLLKAEIFQSSGMENEAQSLARKAEERSRNLLTMADEVSKSPLQMAVATALALQRKYEPAAEWIVGVSGQKPTPEAVQMLGNVFLNWSRWAKTQPLPDKTLPLALLEKGLQINPQNGEMLMDYLVECDASLKNESERRSHVERYLNGGGAAGSFMNYYLGMQNWKSGDKDSALRHWDIANKLNPNFPLITKNLCLAIASLSNDQTELEKALAMMELLIRDDPNNPLLLDTRSAVFAKLGRQQDAIRDMEATLATRTDKSEAHAKLAELYDKMGIADLAHLHREAAAKGANGRPKTNDLDSKVHE